MSSNKPVDQSSSSSHFQPQHIESQESGRWSLGSIVSGLRATVDIGRMVANGASYLLGYGSQEGVQDSGIRNPQAGPANEAALRQEAEEIFHNNPRVMAAFEAIFTAKQKLDQDPDNIYLQFDLTAAMSHFEVLAENHDSPKNIEEEVGDQLVAARGNWEFSSFRHEDEAQASFIREQQAGSQKL